MAGGFELVIRGGVVLDGTGAGPLEADVRDWFADVTATEERIASHATTSLDNGLSKTVNWYRDNIGLDEK